METIGEQARKYREGRGWNTRQMADYVETSRQNIEALEAAGNRIPKYLGALAEKMGVSADSMLKKAGLQSALAVTEPQSPYLPGFEKLSIPLLADAGSMGPGSDVMHDEVVVGRLTVSPEWVTRTLKPTKLENLRFIHGFGDSMDPTFVDGDILLVDSGIKDPKIDGVYVLEANDRIYIKRVRQRMDGSFEISSDNANVKTVDVLDGSKPVQVRGRVVWAWNGKKL